MTTYLHTVQRKVRDLAVVMPVTRVTEGLQREDVHLPVKDVPPQQNEGRQLLRRRVVHDVRAVQGNHVEGEDKHG